MKKYLPSVLVLVIGVVIITFYRHVFADIMHFFTKRDVVVVESKSQLNTSLQAPQYDWLDARQLYQAPLMQSHTAPLSAYALALLQDRQALAAAGQTLPDMADAKSQALQNLHGVLACGQGLVVASGYAGEELGNCVVLLHKTADGGYLQSVYGNLAYASARVNRLVEAGEELGKIDSRSLAAWFDNDFALQQGIARYSFKSKSALSGAVALQYLQQHFAPAVLLQQALPQSQPGMISR